MKGEQIMELGVGRIVHYVLANGEHRPAIIVNIFGDTCNLQVFTDSDEEGKFNDELPSVMWATSIKNSEEPIPITWHWPERL